MRKSTLFILLFIVASIAMTPTDSEKTLDYFNQWRPDSGAVGCHDASTINIQVAGSIIFNSSWVEVNQGETFSLSALVVNFGGDLENSSNDVSVGFNILDEDNNLFLSSTIYEGSHKLNANGTSLSPFLANFTAPIDEGNYTLMAYAISGSAFVNNYFNWVRGQVRVTVKAGGPIPPIVSISSTGVKDKIVNFTISAFDDTGIAKIEMSVNDTDYGEITLISNSYYVLNVSTFEPGVYSVKFNITDLDGLSTIKEIIITVPVPPTTTETTTTDASTSVPQTPRVITTTVDYGKFANPILVGALFVGLFNVVLAPMIFRKQFFNVRR